MSVPALVDELRQMCKSRQIEEFWKRCGELSAIWTEEGKRPASDQAIHSVIGQLDSILAENNADNSYCLVSLAILMIRSNLEKDIKEKGDHERQLQSCEFYLNQIESFINGSAQLEGFSPPLNRRKAMVSNLSLLLEQIRDLLFLNIDRSLELVERALEWAQTNASEITPFHTHLCVLSLKGGRWSVILPHLKHSLFEISEGFSKPESFILFFYYGAIIFGVNRQWKSMEQYLINAFACPFNQHSHILIDAFKKYLLVGLILNRKEDKFATYMHKTRAQNSLFAEKQPKPMRKKDRRRPSHQPADVLCAESLEQANRINRIWPYNYFVKECRKDNEREVMQKMKNVFEADGNLGLAEVAVQTLQERRVKNLAGFYVTIPLSKIYGYINLESNEQTKNLIGKVHFINERAVFSENGSFII